MKNFNINYKKVKNKNARNEINKMNFKNNNDIINKSKNSFNAIKDQCHNNISVKGKKIENMNYQKNNYNSNLILNYRNNRKEKHFKTKKNIIKPIIYSNESLKIKGSKSNNQYKLSHPRYTNDFLSNQKGKNFYNINKIIQKTNSNSKSKSSKRNHSAKPNYKNKEIQNFLDIMKKSQIKQYQKLSQFYQKEKSIISSYSLFSFPEINISDDKTIKSNAQIPLEYFGNYLDTYCKEENNLEFKIIPNFIEKQKEINNKMRAIVVNWIIDVHDRFKLLPDTLFLSIIFFDRFMSRILDIKKEKLQLIGVTSLLIGCKYEEIFSPEIRDFVCILDRTYEKEDIIEQENYMLKVLKFEITFPTSLRYYEILRILFDIENKYYDYGIYLLTLCLIDCRFSKYTQAVIATTVCFFIKKIFYGINLKEFLVNCVKIKENEIKNCLIDISFLIYNIDNSMYTAVYKKFKKIANEIKYIVFK